ncbi:MAG: hypothetical protein NT091_01330, partial [Candidatus Falkowbacteria bacterium]|nr:hypothetical protein [Candidatus Falkowbacteria bacterium]
MVMQINERITGSRFLRGVNIFGGVSKDISQSETISLVNELDKICKDFSDVISVAKNSRSLFDRLKETGVLDYQIAKDHGVIGVAARAIGFNVDARIDYPYAAYDKINFQIANEKTGDVFARFYVRVKEVYASIEIIKTALKYISSSQENILDIDQKNSLKKNYYSISITEGWRGDIVYFISTDANGCIDRVDLRDPSFLNWTALGYAGRGNMVPDFPLINKSFSLSYSGNDL